jgi:hypothetical protein
MESNSTIDIVIPYIKSTSEWGKELLYCLRSINKHVRDVNKIYIIASENDIRYLQKTFTNFIPIVSNVTYESKSKDIANKIYTFCKMYSGTKFVYINDDYFFTRDTYLHDTHYGYDTLLGIKRLYSGDEYNKYIDSTIKLFNSPNIKNIDIHYPIIFNRRLFINMFENIYLKKEHSKCLLKTSYMYYNSLEKLSTFQRDIKVYKPVSIIDLESMIESDTMFSIADSALSESHCGIKNYLNSKYKKCKYEKSYER